MARDDEGAVTDGDARRAGRGAGILDGDGDGERDARARTTGDVERARKTEKGAERAGGGDEARMRGARATATRARRARGGERDADRRGEKSAGVGGTLRRVRDPSRPFERNHSRPTDRLIRRREPAVDVERAGRRGAGRRPGRYRSFRGRARARSSG